MTGLIKKLKTDLENGISKQDVQYYYLGIPDDLAKDQLLKGVIAINAKQQSVNAVTTGITELENNEIEVILLKSMQTQVYKNAQIETGQWFTTRVMCGTDDSMNLLTNTIRYIVRKFMKSYGSRQPQIQIVIDDKRVNVEGCVTATLTVTQENLVQQILN